MDRDTIVEELIALGFSPEFAQATLDELADLEAIAAGTVRAPSPAVPLEDFPLQRVGVEYNQSMQSRLHLLLRIQRRPYLPDRGQEKIYEFGCSRGLGRYASGRVCGTPQHSCNLLWRRDAAQFSRDAHHRGVRNRAQRRAAESGKQIEFSLTTNATLLTEEIIEFLSDHKIGVTVSIDGDRELQ